MKRPHASDDVRERALAAVDEGQPVAEVATFFQNDPSTIYRWLRRRRRTGLATRRAHPGRPRGLRPEQEAALRALVDGRSDAILAELCQAWAAQTGQRVSVPTMHRWLRALGITRKKRR